MATPEAAAALLRRFTFTMDPSITDQEEKDGAYQGVLAAGEAAVPAIRAFAAKAESLAWPIKLVKALLPEEAYVDELLLWLDRWDTEYAKFIDPKLQILAALEEFKDPKILAKVEPFLEDVNGDARFLAVGTVVAQDNESAVPALLQRPRAGGEPPREEPHPRWLRRAWMVGARGAAREDEKGAPPRVQRRCAPPRREAVAHDRRCSSGCSGTSASATD